MSKRSEKQHKYNEWFKSQIDIHRPEWMELMTIEKENDVEYVMISIKGTEPDNEIFISTYDTELTIGFDTWHSHYGSFSDEDDNEELQHVLDIVDDLQNQKAVVVSKFENSLFKLSKLKYVEDLSDALKKKRNISYFKSQTPQNRRQVVHLSNV